MLKEEEITQSQAVCGPDGAIDLPVYVSPIAIIYNLPEVAELNLAPATIAGIFNGTITQWNAPEIAADNPGVELPDLAITPVNRSDESGTTENFTEYLAAAAGDAWPHEASGDWPITGTQSAQAFAGSVAARFRATRESVRRRPGGALLWRVGVTTLGVLIIAGGIVLLPLPGPGWLIIFAGLGLLATEYEWARRLLRFAREQVGAWTRWLGRGGSLGQPAFHRCQAITSVLWHRQPLQPSSSVRAMSPGDGQHQRIQ